MKYGVQTFKRENERKSGIYLKSSKKTQYLILLLLQFIKEVTIKTYVLHKNPDGPFHGSC